MTSARLQIRDPGDALGLSKTGASVPPVILFNKGSQAVTLGRDVANSYRIKSSSHPKNISRRFVHQMCAFLTLQKRNSSTVHQAAKPTWPILKFFVPSNIFAIDPSSIAMLWALRDQERIILFSLSQSLSARRVSFDGWHKNLVDTRPRQPQWLHCQRC